MRVLLVLFTIGLAFDSVAQKQRVWIDTDIMIGKFKRDVDDGLALLLALNDTNLDIVGISLVQDVDYGEKVCKKLLNWYAPNRHIPIYKGAKDSTEFGDKTDAFKAIEKELENAPLSILALGPITNVATVMKLRPDLNPNIVSITACAGRKPGMLFNPGSGKVKFSDFNFDLDPWPTQVLLDSDVSVLLAGYDCSDSLFISGEDFIHLKKSKNKGDRWLFRQLKEWENLWSVFLGSKNGFIPFDCSTIGALLYATEFNIEDNNSAYIEVDKNDSKHTVSTKTKPYLYVGNNTAGKKVDYCNHTNQIFKDRILGALNHPDYQ